MCRMTPMIAVIGHVLGILSLIYGFAMMIPFVFEFNRAGDHMDTFLISAFLSLFVGGLLYFINQDRKLEIYPKQAFLLTSICWIWMSFLCALPLYMSHLGLSLTDAVFEAVSGLTTTGSTVLVGLENLPSGILVWRSLTQWFGGFGIIAFAIILLPILRIGGMQLFHSESSDRSRKAVPLTVDYLYLLVAIYVALTLACIISYNILGMNFFEALNHGLTTVSTGGYSIYDSSFGHFDSLPLYSVSIIFMLSGAIPFVLYVHLVKKGTFNFFKDEQFKGFLFIALWASLVIALSIIFLPEKFSLTHLIPIVFSVVSVMTTTGYAVVDYQNWGLLALGIFFFLTYFGGCAGSTAGGLKIFRLLILFRVIALQLKKLVYPRGVFTVKFNGKNVEIEQVMSIMAFFFLYVLTNIIVAILLSLTGVDFITALSGAATAVANVGPGLGDVIGPAGNFASLSDFAKWTLSIGMLAGRLEILTILLLFVPHVWRN